LNFELLLVRTRNALLKFPRNKIAQAAVIPVVKALKVALRFVALATNPYWL